jgi:hypothetical protein
VDAPDLNSTKWAEQLSSKLGRKVTSGNFRQALQRARREFAEHLLQEVRDSLDDPTPDAVENELADLELLEHCRPFLKRGA